jgi:hypothetical protein
LSCFELLELLESLIAGTWGALLEEMDVIARLDPVIMVQAGFHQP